MKTRRISLGFGVTIAILLAICAFSLIFVIEGEINTFTSALFPVGQLHRRGDGMNLEHVAIGFDASATNLHIPQKYIVLLDEERQGVRQIVKLRLSFSKLLDWDLGEHKVLERALSDVTGPDDTVFLVIQPGKPGGLDKAFKRRVDLERYDVQIDDYYELTLLVPLTPQLVDSAENLLRPNDHISYPDTFIYHLDGIKSNHPCTEYTEMDGNLELEINFSYLHISQWRALDRSARDLVDRLTTLLPPPVTAPAN